ncbi:Alkaline phosphatase synthesis transcriptional regulatory protein PhoP [Capillimicrobium parvum]|uniref:Alkaline phosphatase synthesis transcriptional regulatory protein PhoP n=1 Tax=Capillimicrobium parvum TaxID=2884022 RepID=A0A9E6XUU8_9ACTN|nr:Alkaline phosphatase synthesis transcriptional regulatory protein PhoP [Capillimicrobium parvum]
MLVCDDDPDIRALLRALLERAGMAVSEATDGREALRLVHQEHPALVVLDVNMPSLDGWQTLERLRDFSAVPVLMLTGRDAELEKVRGLRSGADDYVTKPFGRQELLARVQALLRRAPPPGDGAAADVYDDGYVRIDDGNAEVSVLGRPVAVTPLELRLLRTLVRNRGHVLSRDQILDAVWGEGASASQVKLYVGYLRRKLEPASGDVPVPIETVRGFGYRYRTP